ncbi:hypothetical protein, partial [Defluviitalea phaphyphila]|uniref:hypothetical protein n=1 Tax=Defluviitalea phaphyphila TaxID=1473580 RepID=UPI00118760D1
MKKRIFSIIIILFVIGISFSNISYSSTYKKGARFKVIEREGNSYIKFPVTSTKASSEIGLRWETEAYKITMFPKGTQININGEED